MNAYIPNIRAYIKTRKLILLYAFLYTLVVLSVVLQRFWQFEAFYYDQGLFDRAIWLVSRFKEPIIEHQTLGRVHHFADHFVPSLYVMFSPWYWISSRYDITLIALSIYTGLSVLVAYEIASLKIKNRYIIYALIIAYTWYIGLQNALIFFIHDITAMLLPLLLLFYFLFREKWKWFFLFLLFNLGFKETIAAVAMSLGIFMWLYNKRWRMQAIAVIFISLVYGFVITKIIIPYFSNGRFLYNPMWPSQISDYITRFVDKSSKIQVIFYTLATYGFLPILAPATYILFIQDLGLRFVLSETISQRLDLGLHYNANLAVFTFVSAVLGASYLQRKKWLNDKKSLIYALVIILVVFVVHRFVLRGPFGLFYNLDFYRHTFRQGFMHDFINKIPTKGKIMTQNNIAVFFTHNDLYILNGYDYLKRINPDTVAIDLRPGQNPNNLWPMDEKGMTELVKKIKEDQKYKIYYGDANRYIFIKRN